VHSCTFLRSCLLASERTIKLEDGTAFNRIVERTNGAHGVAPLKKATRSDSLRETCRTRIRFARKKLNCNLKTAGDSFLKRATILRNRLTYRRTGALEILSNWVAVRMTETSPR